MSDLTQHNLCPQVVIVIYEAVITSEIKKATALQNMQNETCMTALIVQPPQHFMLRMKRSIFVAVFAASFVTIFW